MKVTGCYQACSEQGDILCLSLLRQQILEQWSGKIPKVGMLNQRMPLGTFYIRRGKRLIERKYYLEKNVGVWLLAVKMSYFIVSSMDLNEEHKAIEFVHLLTKAAQYCFCALLLSCEAECGFKKQAADSQAKVIWDLPVFEECELLWFPICHTTVLTEFVLYKLEE